MQLFLTVCHVTVLPYYKSCYDAILFFSYTVVFPHEIHGGIHHVMMTLTLFYSNTDMCPHRTRSYHVILVWLHSNFVMCPIILNHAMMWYLLNYLQLQWCHVSRLNQVIWYLLTVIMSCVSINWLNRVMWYSIIIMIAFTIQKEDGDGHGLSKEKQLHRGVLYYDSPVHVSTHICMQF